MLGDLIKELKKHDPTKVVKEGFHDAMSYRGIYSELGVAPKSNVPVGELIKTLEGAVGKTFVGYKGGNYRMSEYSDVYLAHYGSTGIELSVMLLRHMLKDVAEEEEPGIKLFLRKGLSKSGTEVTKAYIDEKCNTLFFVYSNEYARKLGFPLLARKTKYPVEFNFCGYPTGRKLYK